MGELLQGAGLTGIVLIDIAIGIIFAVLTFSLIASALNEAIAGVLNYRGEHLRRGIVRMINQADLTQHVLTHPLIKSLKGPKNLAQKLASILFMWGDAARDPDRMPSAIPKATFARAVVEALVNRREDLAQTVGSTAESVAARLGEEIDQLAVDRRLKRRLLAVATRIDFDRVERGVGSKLDAIAGKAESVARDLGIEIEALGLDSSITQEIKSHLSNLNLSGRAAEVERQVLAVADELSMEDALRGHVRDALQNVDFAGIEQRVTATIDHASARAEQALQETMDEIEEELAEWFDSAMDRVTGWYVRRAKTMLFLVGLGLAAATNFDLIGYGKQLAADDALRSAIVQRAQAAAATGQIGAFDLDAPRTLELSRQAAGKDPADLSEQEKTAIRAMSFFDTNRDNEIDEDELKRADQQLRAALALVSERSSEAVAAVTGEFADQGVTLGAPFWPAEPLIKLRMILSWLLIGIGCTLGGQFWFDLLKTFLRVRAGASGLNSDIEKLTRRLHGASRSTSD